MRFTSLGVAVLLVIASCGSSEEASRALTTATSSTTTSVAATTARLPTTAAERTTTTGMDAVGWTGREVELRRPPGSESVPGPLDSALQTVVWIDGAESGLWTWDTPGYGVFLVGEGPNPHRVQWEPEATPDAPPPEPVPIEVGTINDLMLWALATLEEYPDGSGGRYRIVDWQPIRLIENDGDFALTTSQCFYKDGRTARLFGWVAREDIPPAPESGEPDPVEPSLAFELASTVDGLRIAGVDPDTMTCSP